MPFEVRWNNLAGIPREGAECCVYALFGAKANDRALQYHADPFEKRNRSHVRRLCFGDNTRERHLAKGMPQCKSNCFSGETKALILGQQNVRHFDFLSVVVRVERHDAKQWAWVRACASNGPGGKRPIVRDQSAGALDCDRLGERTAKKMPDLAIGIKSDQRRRVP